MITNLSIQRKKTPCMRVIYDHSVKYDHAYVPVCISLVSPFKIVIYINQNVM